MSNFLTEVRLLSVPLENDYKHTLYFLNRNDQTNYFLSKTATLNGAPLVKTECSYQRKDKIIRFPAHVDDLMKCNYVMYKNKSNKWYYAFITRMDYKNDDLTEITIETDVMQTWLKGEDYVIKPSFIEREHVDSDIVGEHTTPEMLETGEFVCNSVSTDEQLKDYAYIIQVTEKIPNEGQEDQPIYSTNFGGVWSAGGAYIVPYGQNVSDVVNLYTGGKKDAVFGVYLVPKKLIINDNEDWLYSGQAEPVKYNHSIGKPDKIGTFTPKNKKLLAFPYNYILLSNNSGASNILHYEHFDSVTCDFEIEGVPTVGGSVKCVPLKYKGVERMQEEGIMLGKFPVCSWSEDIYTNWLTQNAVNLGVGLASQGLQFVGGLAMLTNPLSAPAGASMMTSSALGVAQTMGQIYQMSFTPNSAQGNTNGGDINTCNKMNTFYFYKMSIKEEYARQIDGYFNMYGYKVNRVGVPIFGHRLNYWYTQTKSINIDGAIPMEDLQKIKLCYDTGITFWINPANIGDYSVSNEITG